MARESCSPPAHRPEDMFRLIERHRVTHLKVVPALLIRLINDPSIGKVRPVVAARDPERRPAHAAGSAPAHAAADSGRVRSGELRHVRGHAVLRAPRRSGGREARDLRASDLPRRRGETGRRRGSRSCGWRNGGADLPRAVYAARLFRRAGVQRAPVHARRLLPLGRPDAPASVGQLRGRGPQEGPDQPRRREDQRRGNREPDPVASGGAERRLRAGA